MYCFCQVDLIKNIVRSCTSEKEVSTSTTKVCFLEVLSTSQKSCVYEIPTAMASIDFTRKANAVPTAMLTCCLLGLDPANS